MYDAEVCVCAKVHVCVLKCACVLKCVCDAEDRVCVEVCGWGDVCDPEVCVWVSEAGNCDAEMSVYVCMMLKCAGRMCIMPKCVCVWGMCVCC